jgi:hypothetical protein
MNGASDIRVVWGQLPLHQQGYVVPFSVGNLHLHGGYAHMMSHLAGDSPCNHGNLGISHVVTFLVEMHVGLHVKCSLL